MGPRHDISKAEYMFVFSESIFIIYIIKFITVVSFLMMIPCVYMKSKFDMLEGDILYQLLPKVAHNVDLLTRG